MWRLGLGLALAGCAPDALLPTATAQRGGGGGAPTDTAICPPYRVRWLSDERRVNVTTADAQHHATVDLDPEGRALFAYNEGDGGHGVVARLVAADGTGLSGERALAPASEPGSHPQVLRSGDRFFVGWHLRDGGGVRLRALRPQPRAVGDVVDAFDLPGVDAAYVDLAADPGSGGIVAAWLAWHPTAGGRIVSRPFDKHLVPRGPAIALPSVTGADADGPVSVGMTVDRVVVLAWVEQGPVDGAVLVARTTPAGALLEDPQIVASGQTGFGRPELATLPDGGFAVAWRLGEPPHDAVGAWFRVYGPDGTPRTDPVWIGPGGHPTLAAFEGGLLVAWDETVPTPAWSDVYLAAWSLDGDPLATPERVNVFQVGPQQRPNLALLPDAASTLGVITWESNGQDSDDRAVFVRQLAVESGCP